MPLLNFNIYQINSTESLVGIKLRGRIRKFALENNFNLLTDNAQDEENTVRFALLLEDNDKLEIISEYIKSITQNCEIKLVMQNVRNPILSKLKTNLENRYNQP